jgi:tripartite ATP-independent transporter DctP family solute receptor
MAILALPVFSQTTVLRYSHPNAPTSIAGMQADYFAKKVSEYTKGAVSIEIYPNSALGSLADQAKLVSAGAIALHHNTAAGIGSLFEPFAVLDTPFLYRDVDQLTRVVDPSSPVMTKLNEGLVKKSGVRVLYTFYFGARELTCDRPIKKPADLKGLKIRSVPFPIYQAAIEGMGGIPTALDWAQTPTALSTKVVQGQENPVNTILSAKLYESQGYIMMTNHILGAEIVVINESVWKGLSKAVQQGIAKAAAETSAYATKLTLGQEASDLAGLKAKGMKVIGAAEGLDLEAFRASTKKTVDAKFGSEWAEYYKAIASIK